MKIPEAVPERLIKVPMIMKVKPSFLIHAINRVLEDEDRDPIPEDATLSVSIPGGGDYSNMDLELDEGNRSLDIRWDA